jgi:hypothetical protein
MAACARLKKFDPKGESRECVYSSHQQGHFFVQRRCKLSAEATRQTSSKAQHVITATAHAMVSRKPDT